jgi:hypothetical protein
MALFAAGAMLEHCQSVGAPRFIVLGVVGDVAPLGLVCHGYGSCQGMPTPIKCQKFDPNL